MYFLSACAFLAACSLSASLIAFCASPTVAATQDKPKQVGNAGQELFERVWDRSFGSDPPGDGLGPLYNERSCVACHFQGGVGGAGPNQNNVRLLTVAPQKRDATGTDQLRQGRNTVTTLHRGFEQSATVVLHRYSTRGPHYQTFLDNLIGLDPKDALDPLRRPA